ncbi:hypothetical protein MKY34_16700 [Sporosarcina sp. FSL K6-1522]|uniref:hypothetical protein n=1 Tax=Sporosarcina sp. FSL K6-1522 TaxID=2921554 RepID=UPI00315B3004
MAYVVYIEVDEKGIITRQHRDPFNPITGLKKTMSELLITGFLIDPFTEPEIIEGKQPMAMFDGAKVYYEYVDIEDPKTDKEELEALKRKVDTQDRVIEEILFTIIPEITGGGI